MSFWFAISCAHAPGDFLTSISFVLFDLSNRRFSKNQSLPVVLFWQISATICVCLLISFFLSYFDHKTFERVSTVAYSLMGVILELKLNQKSGFTILHALMLLIRIVWSFLWRKFSSVGKGEWWDEMKYGHKIKLGDAHVTPRNIQEVQASKLGDAPRHPFFINKYQVIFQDTIFLLLRILCIFLRASLFLLSVFFCFICCNKWLVPNIFILEKTHSIFHCQEHSSFHSYRSTSVLFF
jgi:hypothetical protein